MARYAALLRGVNVGGGTRVDMAGLREVFTGLGCADVSTYLQSGNVVFTAGGTGGLAALLELRIGERFGVATRVLLRGAGDLSRVLAANPYADEHDPAAVHVVFLEREPAPEKAASLTAPVGETARFTLAGREVYLHCPDGYGRTKLNNTAIERRLDVTATTRNWRTVTALHKLTAA